MEILDGIHIALTEADIDQLNDGKCIMTRGLLLQNPVVFYLVKVASKGETGQEVG